MALDGSIGMDVVFKQVNGLMSNDLDGDTVLMSVESGAYYGLEATDQAIWSYLAQPIRVAELLRQGPTRENTCENGTILSRGLGVGLFLLRF
jgi:hypothetical protein